MLAQRLHQLKTPLRLEEIPTPKPKENELLIHVEACGVCRTDLHIIDGELSPPEFPLILGHQIVGTVVATGSLVTLHQVGDRVGVPWLAEVCQTCSFCLKGKENLCDRAKFTGFDRMGGFAAYTTAQESFCFPLPKERPAELLAPLLCAGLIGFRGYRQVEHAQTLALYGFGSAAHLIASIALEEGKQVIAMVRPHDEEAKQFAKAQGVHAVYDSTEAPDEPFEAALIFAPRGELLIEALKHTQKGGTVVSCGIHLSQIPSFPYAYLFEERTLTSVSHLTRDDGKAFFKRIENHPLTPKVTTYPMEEANQALKDLRQGKVTGSIVLLPFREK